ncbi:hypothetical protein BCV72DRAFT_245101 [Rhizopus microsporus var. microsporus]|uniref:Uncharacterized protein n=1 Tax=Rhizopus microsporus var. microsporus TaxID=86635 RepID=A0A1X0QRZ2_RHIZD|nr:hypothetical protein BCV72DRAFT_245101 [Rhizopus microsporus var. microsporus]
MVKNLIPLLLLIDPILCLFNRGDTMTNPCKSKGLKFKLDLHIVVLNDKEVVVDGMAAEVAKTATKHKLYEDKLKSILATKCHIKNFLETVPYITAEDIKKLKFPIMQIMGMNVHIYVLRLPCRGIYVVDNGFSFSFPCNMKLLRTETEKLIDGLSLVEALLEDLSLIYETSQIDPSDSIKRVVEGSGRKKKLNIKAWTTEVFYNDDYDTLIDDNEEDEQVDEDIDEQAEDE